MIVFLFFVALSCPKTQIVNTSKLAWNKYDQEMLDHAKKRCGELYDDSPCLKWFKKYAFQQYSAICGQKR